MTQEHPAYTKPDTSNIMSRPSYTNASEIKKSAQAPAPAPVYVPEFNPLSRYQEKVVVPYLTLFDIERKARESTKQICRLPVSSVNTLFHCPVCLGYMKKTYIVMECLHRFCGDCIQKCLRLGKKECPSCRVHIPSRRSLRPDLNYDELLKKMFGDVEALESHQDKEIESWNKRNNMNNAYTTRRNLEISKQANIRRKGRSKVGEKGVDIEGSEESKLTSAKIIRGGIRNLEESPLIDFVLRLHPQEKRVQRLHRECIRTAEEITIGHLKRFLGKKVVYEPYFQVQICITLLGGKLVVLDDEITLRDVRDDISDKRSGKIMVLQYRVNIQN